MKYTIVTGVLNVKDVFNQEKALIGTFSVVANLCLDLRVQLWTTLPLTGAISEEDSTSEM